MSTVMELHELPREGSLMGIVDSLCKEGKYTCLEDGQIITTRERFKVAKVPEHWQDRDVEFFISTIWYWFNRGYAEGTFDQSERIAEALRLSPEYFQRG